MSARTTYAATDPQGYRVAFPTDADDAEALSRAGWRVRASTGGGQA